MYRRNLVQRVCRAPFGFNFGGGGEVATTEATTEAPAADASATQQAAPKAPAEKTLDNFKDLWDVKPATNATTQDSAPDMSKFDDYAAKLSFTDGLDAQALSDAIASGDATALAKVLDQVGRNAYRKAFSDGLKVNDHRLREERQSFLKQSQQMTQAELLTAKLHEALPITKQPAVGRVASQALDYAIAKGATPEQAISEVRDFLATFAKETSKGLGDSITPAKRATGAHASAPQESKAAGPINWVQALSDDLL